MEVVPAVPEHAEALADVIASAEFLQRYHDALGTPERYVERAFSHGTLLAAVREGVVQGLVWCTPEGTFGRGGYIRLLAVHPRARRSGVGRLLMASAEEVIFQRSGHAFLLTSDFNVPAQRFYEAIGYTRVGAIPGYVVPEITELIYWKRRP